MAFTGQKVTAVSTTRDRQSTTGTTTSTSYTATLTGGVACSFSFVAPESGQVKVNNTLNGFNAGGAEFCSYEIRAGGVIGAGAVFQAANDDLSWIAGANSIAMTHTTVVPGLTPGSTYNIRQMFRVSAGTGTYAWKELSVEGLI